MKLDPQKTTGALAATYLAQIVCWAAQYFWHVTVPDPVATAFTGLLALILVHLPVISINPTTPAIPAKAE